MNVDMYYGGEILDTPQKRGSSNILLLVGIRLDLPITDISLNKL